nr:LuxR C-terminal-related transcriptional regulator [Kibdelosporangium sp. MJ126-NF4]CEL22407.1 transcriptional regulator [Kibdelosporangium sp. MJ126-NF4]CTQ89262.1 transcriptional regulator [Kibdelosporangium sp. MJ126-NF4]
MNPIKSSRVVVLDREQRELLRLLATGLPDTAIARRMALAPRTLARRISSLYQTLQADNRFQAGAAAERLGLLAGAHADEHAKPVAV